MIGNEWDALLKEEVNKEYFKNLSLWVEQQYSENSVLPAKDKMYNALKHTPYNRVKVFVVGQDPYQTKGFAHGLAFSVRPGVKTPKSLQNIYKELNSDLGCYIPNNGYLVKWAEQGVLLLNTVLTVEEGKANSHANKGWETFTDKIIALVNEKDTPAVFMLWGNNARLKKSLITNPKHLILETSHPSPLGAYKGFIGSKPFSKANQFLKENGIEPIDWQIENI